MSEGFLSRWARRKEAVKAAEQAPLPAPSPGGDGGGDGAEGTAALDPAPPLPPASSPQEGGEARELERSVPGERRVPSEGDPEDPLADLPSLDALTPETDLTPFLRTGVPAVLRNAALRRMWSLDPSIRDFVSEAREYAYDWNTPGGVPGMGPLLPSDDVKAMLGRLFRDPAEAATPETEPVAEEPDHRSAEPPEAAVAQAEDEAPAPEAVAVQTLDASTEPTRPRIEQTSRPEPRLRRHGGAMPT